MLKKICVSYTIIVCMVVTMFAVPVLAGPDDYNAVTVAKIQEKTNVSELKAKASVLIDGESGKILLEKNSHDKLPIASVTKVMSMLLVMEAIDSGKIKFEDMVPVSEHSYGMGGSQVYLKPGEAFTVKEMMKAVAVHSANDATVAMAELVAGSEEGFVAKMNEKAKALGMNDTNFLDCTGLTDEGHYSSANDVALMSRELIMKHPKIFEFTTIWHDTFRDGQFALDNTNKLIRFYQGANGLKTGFTNKAGFCLSAAAKRNNMQLISIVLGEADSNTRFAESKALMDYGFANFEMAKVNNKGDEAGEVEIKKGMVLRVKAVYGGDVNILVNKGDKGKITREVKLGTEAVAPIKSGQKVGETVYKLNDNVVGTADIVAAADVEKATFIKVFFKMVVRWFSIGRA